MGRFNLSRPFPPWLYEIARNVAIDANRRNKRWPTGSLPENLQDDRIILPDEQEKVQEILNLLLPSDPQRDQKIQAFKSYRLEARKSRPPAEMEELSKRFGVSLSTFSTWASEVADALRAFLNDNGV